jgi:hypothetical protein
VCVCVCVYNILLVTSFILSTADTIP